MTSDRVCDGLAFLTLCAHQHLVNLTHLVYHGVPRHRLLENRFFGTELLDEAGNHFLCVVNGAGDVLDLLEGRAAKLDPDARAAPPATTSSSSSVITLFMSAAFFIFNASFAIP